MGTTNNTNTNTTNDITVNPTTNINTNLDELGNALKSISTQEITAGKIALQSNQELETKKLDEVGKWRKIISVLGVCIVIYLFNKELKIV